LTDETSAIVFGQIHSIEVNAHSGNLHLIESANSKLAELEINGQVLPPTKSRNCSVDSSIHERWLALGDFCPDCG
jgi:hypothetical protein